MDVPHNAVGISVADHGKLVKVATDLQIELFIVDWNPQATDKPHAEVKTKYGRCHVDNVFPNTLAELDEADRQAIRRF